MASLEEHRMTVALSVVVLSVAVVLISKGRRRDALITMLGFATIGAVLYPLALCLFMGFAGASSTPSDHYWLRFRFAFSIYAQSAINEAIPRGAGLGVFVAAWRLFRQSRKLRLAQVIADRGLDTQSV